MGFNSANPLSIAEISAYIQSFTAIETLEERKHFLYLMGRLDGTWLEITAKKESG